LAIKESMFFQHYFWFSRWGDSSLKICYFYRILVKFSNERGQGDRFRTPDPHPSSSGTVNGLNI
jgi:hypothetical protein